MNTFKDPAELIIMQMRLFNLQYYVTHKAEIDLQTKEIKERMGEG